jgi:hypothetical protein
VVQDGVRDYGIEAGQVRRHDVALHPRDGSGGEPVLCAFQDGRVDVQRGDVRCAPRQARGKEPVTASDVEDARRAGGNPRIQQLVVMDVEVPWLFSATATGHSPEAIRVPTSTA